MVDKETNYFFKHLNVLKCLGIIPFKTEQQNNPIFLLLRIYSLLLCLLYAILTIKCYTKFTQIVTNSLDSFNFVSLIYWIASTGVVFYCTLNSYYSYKTWNKCIQKLEDFCLMSKNNSIRKFQVIFLILACFNTFYDTYTIVIGILYGKLDVYWPLKASNFYKLNLGLHISQAANILFVQYKLLHKRLKTICIQDSNDCTLRELQDISNVYKNLNKVVKITNKTFGSYMCWIFLNSLTQALHGVNIIIFERNLMGEIEMLLISLYYAIINDVSFSNSHSTGWTILIGRRKFFQINKDSKIKSPIIYVKLLLLAFIFYIFNIKFKLKYSLDNN